MEETKSNPKLLMALGGGIVFIIVGVVGIILSAVRLSRIKKD